MQLSLFDALAAEAPTLDELLAQLGRHDWNRVGAARTKGGATFHTFRYAATDDERELAEGELPYWIADLDRASATYATRARADIGAIEVVISRQGLSNRVKSAREQLRHITDVALRRRVHEELVRAEAVADERLTRMERRAAEQERAARPRAQQAAPARPNPAHRHTKAEVRAVLSDAEVLRAAGWTRVAGDALGLTWTHPDPEKPAELFHVTFDDLDDLSVAAGFLRTAPDLAPAELLERMGIAVEVDGGQD